MSIESIEKKTININVVALIMLMLFVIGQAITFTSWATALENNLEDISIDREQIIFDINDLEEKQALMDITNAKIEVKLNNIETILLEIKTDIKNHII